MYLIVNGNGLIYAFEQDFHNTPSPDFTDVYSQMDEFQGRKS